MQGEVVADRAATARPAGEDGADDSTNAIARHEQLDPVADMVAQIRAAAARGEPLAAGARVRVRKLAAGACGIEREGRP
jgi:hypothetical protein